MLFRSDPIARWEEALAVAGWLDEALRDGTWEEARAEVAAAEEFAANSNYPDPSSAMEAVFTGDSA